MFSHIRPLAFSIIVVCATAAATPSLAQWYGGANAGRAQISYNTGQLANDLASHGITGTGSTDETDLGFKLFAGYQLNDTFALEGGYIYLGKYDITGTYSRPLPAGTFSGDVKRQGANIDLVGKIDLGSQMSAYGRLGAAYVNTKASAAGSSASFVGYSNATKNQVVPDVGAGFQYDISKTVAARLEWQHFFQVGDSTTGRADIDLFTVGLIRKF